MINRYASLRQGLVGAWCPSVQRCGGGFRLPDLSGYGNHGTLTNMDPGTDWVASGSGLAIDFDGSNDRVATTCPGVTTNRRAVSVWFKTSLTLSNAQYAGIVRWGTATSFPADNGKDFGVQFGNDANFGSTGFGVSQYGDGLAVTGLNDGTWHHGYVDSVGSLYSIYIDGVFRTSKTMTTNATAGTVVIGRTSYGGVEYFPGQLDDIRIYNRALTRSEIQLLYTGGRGVGLAPERIKHRRKTTAAAAFKAAWARRQQHIGSGVY